MDMLIAGLTPKPFKMADSSHFNFFLAMTFCYLLDYCLSSVGYMFKVS